MEPLSSLLFRQIAFRKTFSTVLSSRSFASSLTKSIQTPRAQLKLVTPFLTQQKTFTLTPNFLTAKESSESSAETQKFRTLKKQRKTKKEIESTFSTPSFKVKALATSDYYDLESLKRGLINSGAYEVYEFSKDLPEECLCVRAKYPALNEIEPRHIFFFEDGAVVFWNVSAEEQHNVLELVKKSSDKSYPIDVVNEESEMMTFSRLTPPSDENESHDLPDGKSTPLNFTRMVKNHIYFRRFESGDRLHFLEKFAFSDAIALSVKLGIWEKKLENFTDKIEYISEDLKRGDELNLSIDEILQKLGELFTMRHTVNLNSNFLETPDFYWDRERLESLYTQLYYHLSIAKRTRLFNEKLNHCIDLMQILKQHLNDNKHTRLEWIIIGLIAIEVATALGLLELVKTSFIQVFELLKGVF